MRKAVYAGSFDPPTNGHLWMIEQGVVLFDELVVAIGNNPDKKYTFDLRERLQLLTKVCSHLDNVTVAYFGNQYLVRYADTVGACYILRGLRSTEDYAYERMMKQVNKKIAPDIKSIYLMSPPEMEEVSSSVVKGLIGPEGWEEAVRAYVPSAVFKIIKQQFSK